MTKVHIIACHSSCVRYVTYVVTYAAAYGITYAATYAHAVTYTVAYGIIFYICCHICYMCMYNRYIIVVSYGKFLLPSRKIKRSLQTYFFF